MRDLVQAATSHLDGSRICALPPAFAGELGARPRAVFVGVVRESRVTLTA